jgi:hypothetical protein
MTYVVAEYYIGFMSRYDGTANTDMARISLFREKQTAIDFIIKKIIENEADDATLDETKNPAAPPTFNDIENLIDCLEQYEMYNYDNLYMFTLELISIK